MTDTRDKILGTIQNINPGLDVIGPITDIIATPIGSEIDDLDERILSIQSLLSSTFDADRTDEEIDAIVATRGILRDQGSKSSGAITFRFSSVPNAVSIPGGTEVSTVDSLYQYTLVEDFSPTSTEIQQSFNSVTSLYEITADIQAIEVGIQYNIAATRVRRITASLPAGTTIINLAPISGGSDIQTNEELWEEFQNAGTIADSSSNEGIRLSILSAFEDIKDIYISNITSPANPNTLENPIIDVFAIGEIPIELTEQWVVQDSKVTLAHPFISEIVLVANDTTSTEITLYSLEGQTLTILETVTDGDVINVTYRYNSLMEELQIYLENQENNFFNYTMIVTEAVKEELRIAVNIKFQASFIDSVSVTDIENVILEYYNTLYFTTDDLQLQDLTVLLREIYAGIVSINVLDFTKATETSYLVGFPVFVNPPNYPHLLLDNLTVSISVG